jgi:hypothetical protein
MIEFKENEWVTLTYPATDKKLDILPFGKIIYVLHDEKDRLSEVGVKTQEDFYICSGKELKGILRLENPNLKYIYKFA